MILLKMTYPTSIVALLLATTSVTHAAGLVPFRMPYNDASEGITNLQSWQPTEAGLSGRITTTPEGHYSYAGKGIKFIGVNITAGDCFPSHALADAHAARLARFGFNAVRFHHMEAPWDKSNVLIDYDSGSSRNLSAARLDRMHYFIAQLAARGIYTNINLLVSREFQATDGLGPEITQLGWKNQHILGFFHDPALALHKEFATTLLTAPNPYRGGKTLLNDPAVAFIEIMNENGLLQKWYEGVLDTLPATYAQSLEDKWNAWLQTKYPSTAALNSAWKAVDIPLGANLLTNGNFASGMGSWNLERHSTAVASSTAQTAFNGSPSLLISVTTAGTEGWHVQLTQGNLTLTKGNLYTLSYWGKAANSTSVSTSLTRTGPTDYSGVIPSLNATLSTTWTQYSTTFVAGTNEASLRLVFNGFGGRTASIQLADVRLQEGGKVGALPDGVSLEAGNIPVVLRNSGASAPTAEQAHDWVAYVFGREKIYWDTMRDHVKTTLGFPGIMWGSIISNSPTNTQSGLDAMDSHSYWQHPSFPVGFDFDPVQWTLNNVSMVNFPDNNTLGGIARQRVQGKPHNVTEYQHCSPNVYSSEGPLLAGVYGALQDWDSFWMFEYKTGSAEFTTGFFDTGGHAGKMVNHILAATLFRRGDVAAARRNYRVAMTPDREIEAARTVGGAWSIADGSHLGVSQKLTLESRFALNIGEGATGLDPIPEAPAGNVFTSDTGEVVWDMSVPNKGIVTVNTPLSKALAGFVNGRSFDLGGVTITPGSTRQDWCTIGLSLLTGPGFEHAGGGTGVIIATGDQENTGQIWKDGTKTSIGSNWGSAPVVVEVIPATITLPVAPSRVHVWALDGSGQRMTAVAIRDSGGKAQFDLGANGNTLWYEFAIDAGTAFATVISRHPSAVVTSPGSPVTLSVTADGFPTPTYQWYHNNARIDGATRSSYVIASASEADLGSYYARVANTVADIPTRTASVAFASGIQTSDSRLSNVSTRANVGTGAHVIIAGFALQGARDVLVRGSGPILSVFGVPGVLPDPLLECFAAGNNTAIRTNDSWDSTEIGALSTTVGAFPFTGYPKEAGASLSLAGGNYTAQLKDSTGATGVGLVEVYDAGGGAGRIVNLSTRGDIGQGPNSLFVGFAISGTAPKHVLIRGIGPTLGVFGLADSVADPKMTLYHMVDGVPLHLMSNDDWQDTQEAALRADMTAGFGFALPDMSRDACIDIWLEPGLYSAKLESKGTAGLGLVEVYEIF